MARVFISYSHKDRKFVHRLTSDLRKYIEASGSKLEIFYDQLIEPGESWAKALSSAIESAEYVLAVLSPDYLSSSWAMQEFSVAMLRNSEGKARLIPLRCEEFIPTGLATQLMYIDFVGPNYREGFKRLLAALGIVVGEQGAGAEAAAVEPMLPETGERIERLKEKVRSFKAPQRKAPQRSAGEEGKKCFIIMPFGDEELNVVYEDFVKPVVENECKLKCERGDDVFGSNVIMDDILSSIKTADLMIADLTKKNANVFYEVGICHVLKKEVLLLAQSIDDVPFDLRHRRVLLYEYSPRGCKRLEKSLKDNLDAIIKKLETKNGKARRGGAKKRTKGGAGKSTN